MSEKKRVAVGLSGGVDSALSAYLLKKQGYEVVGMTMATWDGSVKMPAVEGREGCYGPSEDKNIEEAKLVAERLGIPHYVVPVAEDYKREVLDYFRAEYRAGRTPNPCVRCNQSIKFGALQHAARKLGIDFDYFATGHYARLDFKNPDVPFLYEAFDEHKDQTYFLSRLSAEQLSTVIFPLGGMQKADVKALAKEIGWDDFATKRESQDFIECGDYSVLFDESDNIPGDFVDVNGNIQYPVLGNLHVAGMTRLQLQDTITKMLINGGYLAEPVVLVRLKNYKIYIKSATGSHTVTVTNERVTLLEALSQSGNISAYTRLDKVGVLREEGGRMHLRYLNLKSKDVFNDPYFLLQQNDVVLLEPLRASRIKENASWIASYASLTTSLISIVTLIITLATPK